MSSRLSVLFCYQGKYLNALFICFADSDFVQIQASGQRIEYFQSTQLRCGFPEAVKIPLHSNIRWGTAFKMLDQGNKLRQVSRIAP